MKMPLPHATIDIASNNVPPLADGIPEGPEPIPETLPHHEFPQNRTEFHALSSPALSRLLNEYGWGEEGLLLEQKRNLFARMIGLVV